MLSLELVYDLQAENYCTHFILPLLRLSKSSFLASNFVNSYLTRDRKYIVVEVVSLMLIQSTVYKRHPNYMGMIRRSDHILLVYDIPTKWYLAVLKFTEGLYSEMPADAKRAIRMYSKLPEDDGRILALDKSDELKDMWERELLVHLADGKELLSKPDLDHNYIEISNVKLRG